MTLALTGITVGTSATMLLAPKMSRTHVLIQNGDAAAIFVGPSSAVTATGATTGISVAAAASIEFTNPREALWAISAAGTAANAVRVLETNGV